MSATPHTNSYENIYRHIIGGGGRTCDRTLAGGGLCSVGRQCQSRETFYGNLLPVFLQKGNLYRVGRWPYSIG